MPSRDHATAAAIARFATACDGAVLGVNLAFLTAISWVKYLASSSALRRIRHAPSARISDLRSLLSSSSAEDEGRLVVVRGQVQPTSAADSSLPRNLSALVSQGSGERAVIVLQTQTCLYNEGKGIFGWSSDLPALFAKTSKEQRSRSLISVPFILVEGGQFPQSESVDVRLDGSDHPLPLTTVYHHLHPVQASPLSIFQAIFGQRYPVALLDEEKILPVGKVITAVGICRTQDGAIVLRSCKDLPYFLSDKPKNEIETDLTIDTKILFWGTILLGALSVGILGYAGIRKWQRWLRKRRQSQSEDGLQSSSDEDVENIPDGELCVICLIRRRSSAFVPCGHRVCCPSCVMSMQLRSSPNCPVCRQSIHSYIRIYDS